MAICSAIPITTGIAGPKGCSKRPVARIPKKELFRKTGVAFQPFNTLFQLLAMRLQKPEVLDQAGTLLMMPDLLAYALTGERGTEYTDASTSQLLDASARTWSDEILKAMGIPREIFTPISSPGTIRGTLRESVAAAAGAGRIPVIAVAGHDTASAVVAVPLSGPRFGVPEQWYVVPARG